MQVAVHALTINDRTSPCIYFACTPRTVSYGYNVIADGSRTRTDRDQSFHHNCDRSHLLTLVDATHSSRAFCPLSCNTLSSFRHRLPSFKCLVAVAFPYSWLVSHRHYRNRTSCYPTYGIATPCTPSVPHLASAEGFEPSIYGVKVRCVFRFHHAPIYVGKDSSYPRFQPTSPWLYQTPTFRRHLVSISVFAYIYHFILR